MENFPSNSKRPANIRPGKAPRAEDQPQKKVERVVTGEVVRRKTPLGKRLANRLLPGNPENIWEYMVGDVIIPAMRDTVFEAFMGGFERMMFPDSDPPRRRLRPGPGPGYGYTAYHNQYTTVNKREERRAMSPRGRANHSFDEIILPHRAEAEEILYRLFDYIQQFDEASVADLYEMCGISSNFTDQKWGWTELPGAYVSRTTRGYLLNLPRPIPLE